jgi:hypothetical protein
MLRSNGFGPLNSRPDFDVYAIWILQNFGLGNLGLQKVQRPEIHFAESERLRVFNEVNCPPAVMNALNRLARGYEEAEQSTRQELALAESQVRDFQTRQGAAFPHESYLKALSALREQLRIALSGVEAKQGESAADIAGRIKALRSQNSVEPVPQREAKTIAAEEPVTARIRRRAEERAIAGNEGEAETGHPEKWQRKLAEEARAHAGRVREPG